MIRENSDSVFEILNLVQLYKQYYLFTDSSKHSWSGILIQYIEQIKEGGTKLKIPHPITYQSCTFQGSQKNWSTLTKEVYAIYMSFYKMVFYLKESHVMVRCDHVPLQKFMYSVTRNDKVNNWSQETHSITSHIDFKHIKGKENVIADSLLRLRCLGLDEDNDPENTVCSVKSNQNVNNEFEIDAIKYCLNEKYLTYFQSQGTDAHIVDANSFSHIYNLYPTKIKQLKQQDIHISKLLINVNQRKLNKKPYCLDEHGITYRKKRDGPNIFHTIMVPNTLQPYILYESHNALGHNGSTRLHNFIRGHYYWKKLCQHCNKYV